MSENTWEIGKWRKSDSRRNVVRVFITEVEFRDWEGIVVVGMRVIGVEKRCRFLLWAQLRNDKLDAWRLGDFSLNGDLFPIKR